MTNAGKFRDTLIAKTEYFEGYKQHTTAKGNTLIQHDFDGYIEHIGNPSNTKLTKQLVADRKRIAKEFDKSSETYVKSSNLVHNTPPHRLEIAETGLALQGELDLPPINLHNADLITYLLKSSKLTENCYFGARGYDRKGQSDDK